MTTTTADTVTRDRVRALAPVLRSRAEEIEENRRIPPDLVQTLAAAGCFRMYVPRDQGGDEQDLLEVLDVLEQLAAADASTAWIVALGGLAPIVLSKLDRPVFERFYAGGADLVLAGTFNPTGVAAPVKGGYRVTGQWSFASGCQHADRFIAHCVVDDGRVPPVRMMVLEPSDVEIVDTWWASGLRGTGSHDFRVDDVFVPAEHSFLLEDPPTVDGVVFGIPELALSTMQFAAIAVGSASAALADVTDLAMAKVPAFTESTLAVNPWFRHAIGEAEARIRAARAALRSEADRAWGRALAGEPFTPEDRARMRSTASWVTAAAVQVVDTAYGAGGGTSVYASSPLQRRFRDVHALTQHFTLKPDTFTTAGAVLLGQEVDLTFL